MNAEYKKFIVENHRLNKYDIVDFAEKELKLTLWPRQKKILREFYKSDKRELLLICGKKASKTFMATVIALYEVYKLMLIDNPQKHYGILTDQPIYVLNTCTNKSQAKNIFLEYAKGMINQSDFMKMCLDKKFTSEEIKFDKNVRLMSQSSNSTSSLGYTCIAVMFDELAWFRDTAGNLSGKAVYDALKPNIKPFGNDGKVIVFSSPGTKSGVYYKIYLDSFQFDDIMRVHAATWEVNPNITRKDLDRDFQKDPLKARMDFGAEFVDVSGSALNSKKIDEAIKHENLDVNNITNWENEYVISLDPGLKSDAYALAMGHYDDGIYYDDLIHTWQGTSTNPVDIEEVEDFIRFLCKNFNVRLIVLDQHQSASTIQRLTKEGYNIKETVFTAKYNVAIYTLLIELLNGNKAHLPKDHTLVSEMKSLRRIGAGKYAKYEAPTSGAVTNDDCVDAVANCFYQIKQLYFKEEQMGVDDFACDGVLTQYDDNDKMKEKDKDEKGRKPEDKDEVEEDEFKIY